MDWRSMAELTRLELATFRVTGGRSNQTELQLHNDMDFIALIKFWRQPGEASQTLKAWIGEDWLPGQDSNLRPND